MLQSYNPEKGIYPLTIHADCLMSGKCLFPTHTHGLTEIGMAEFIIDPLAFGGIANGGRIHFSVAFFMKQENSHMLRDILNGNVIKLPAGALNPNLRSEPYTYCFREVLSTFEAVNQAYIIPGPGIKPGMRVIQIWVDGDDFALTDEYYRGGVTC